MSRKILFIGPCPPPSGGISIHIKRLSELLSSTFKIDFVDEVGLQKPGIFNIRSLNIFIYLSKICKTDIVYIHSGNSVLRVFHILTAKFFFKKVLLTIHAFPFTKNPIVKVLEETVYRQSDKIILVNSNLFEKVRLPKEKCIVRNAFIPPDIKSEPELPLFLNDWIENSKKNGKFLLCGNAWQMEIFNGEDLYGLDLCIEAVFALVKLDYPVCMVYNVSSTSKYLDIFIQKQRLIESLGLSDVFLLINEQLSFVKIIMRCDGVVRPTNTDGDALTVREALYLGKPIIASDVVERPAGTLLFENRNSKDFVNRLEELIKNKSANGGSANASVGEDYYKYYLDLINSVIHLN